MKNGTRDKNFGMRLSPAEWERFEAVAAHHEMSVAATVRMLMKREADMLAPAKSFAEALHKRGLRDTLTKETERSKRKR